MFKRNQCFVGLGKPLFLEKTYLGWLSSILLEDIANVFMIKTIEG